MLKKLIKYDMRATSRLLLPINLGFAALTVLCSVGMWAFSSTLLREDAAVWSLRWVTILFILSIVTWMLALFAVAFFSQGYSVYHFYSNLLGNEGYLMHTLPVTPRALVGSKLIVATIWSLICGAVTIVCSGLMTLGAILPVITQRGASLSELWRMLAELLSSLEAQLAAPLWVLAVEMVVFILVGIAFSMLAYYLAIAIGQLIAPKHRILAAVGIYLALNFASQTVYSIFTLIGGLTGMVDVGAGGLPVETFIQLAIVLGIALTAGLATAMYFLTAGCFKKRLNLQ